MAKKSRAFKDDRDDDFGDMTISDEELERLMEAAGAPSPRAPERRPETEFASLEPGTRVRGTVIDIRGGEVLLELDSKTHGVIPEEEYAEDPLPAIGSVVQAQYMRYDRRQDVAVLSVREVRQEILWDELRVGMVLEGLVTDVNKGGLSLDIKRIRAFMPISQIERERVHDPAVYVGRRLQCEVISFERATQNLVVSRRAILEREAAEARAAALDRLTEGDVIRGTVVRVVDFGAFIDLGGFEGLLHQSKIREHHREIGKDDPLVEGQELEVEILRIDPDRGRVALDFRRRPISRADRSVEGYAAGDTVTGWVKHLTEDGAVLALEDGAEGLIPQDQMSESISEGSIVRATVTTVDKERGRLELKPT